LSSRTAALAIGGVVLLLACGCGGKKQTATTIILSTGVDTTRIAPTSSTSVGGSTTITVENGEAVDGPVTIDAAQGDKVELGVRSDARSTVSVGDIVSFSTIPGGTVTMSFVPDRTGRFPVELGTPEGPKRIGTLVVG
jgi:hypothetical protein